MDYTTLGDTGLAVSRVCLGTAGFRHDDDRWGTGPELSATLVDRAIELGVNFFDTANMYGDGDSEEILGDAIDGYDRDELVIASKVHPTLGPAAERHPNGAGLGRKSIEQELRHSLERLGLETIDLYQIHRWPQDAPIAETLRTLDDAVRRGQVRYLGATSLHAYQIATARHESERRGLEPFVALQQRYNLTYREAEREVLPYCDREGIGVIPWQPLDRGYLARPDAEATATERGSDHDWSDHRAGGGREINARVAELADENGVSMAQIAIAWQLHQDRVTAPIVGVSSVEHLEEAVEAVDLSLSSSDIEYLEAPYEPKPIQPVYRNPSDGPYRPLH